MIPALLMDYGRIAHRLGYEKATWFASMRGDLLTPLKQAGCMRDRDEPAYVSERRYPARP